MKILITTIPFGQVDGESIRFLKKNNVDFDINPYKRKIKKSELKKIIHKYDAMIAGTEPLTSDILELATNLKLIVRLGVGVSNIDLKYAKKNNIKISFTPDSPSLSVAEFTVGLAISLIRNIHHNNIQMHNGHWNKTMGRELNEITLGIMGFGRIGQKVYKLFNNLGLKKILVFEKDSKVKKKFTKVNFVEKRKILRLSDLISLHLSSNSENFEIINKESLSIMKKDAILINTSRGDLVNENDLYNSLYKKQLSGAAIDVFSEEPYVGKLKKLNNCILTSHIGSLTREARKNMEIEAVNEIVRFKLNKKLLSKYSL